MIFDILEIGRSRFFSPILSGTSQIKLVSEIWMFHSPFPLNSRTSHQIIIGIVNAKIENAAIPNRAADNFSAKKTEYVARTRQKEKTRKLTATAIARPFFNVRRWAKSMWGLTNGIERHSTERWKSGQRGLGWSLLGWAICCPYGILHKQNPIPILCYHFIMRH